MRVVFVGRHRSIPGRLAAAFLTLGVSRRIWLHRITREVDGHEALGLPHRRNAALLAAPGLGLLLLLILGPAVSWLVGAVVAAPFFVASTLVTARTTFAAARMLKPSPVRFGQAWALYLATWVPILGSLFYIAWVQTRLNRFWAYERKHPEHGVDLDLGLEKDPAFLVVMDRALKASYDAGSRFDRHKAERTQVRAEREAVRQAGGSVPVL
ncbi:MAG TPA: hypothetical protein VI796_02160, partial [Candidatus Thermoplasmatota archaeon]|nr:hypothetical protein [Candidatus Thermoplasmatota archaeon]